MKMPSPVHSVVVAIMLLAVVGIISYLGAWLVNYFTPPEPVRKVLTAAVVVLAVLFAVIILLHAVGDRPLTP